MFAKRQRVNVAGDYVVTEGEQEAEGERKTTVATHKRKSEDEPDDTRYSDIITWSDEDSFRTALLHFARRTKTVKLKFSGPWEQLRSKGVHISVDHIDLTEMPTDAKGVDRIDAFDRCESVTIRDTAAIRAVFRSLPEQIVKLHVKDDGSDPSWFLRALPRNEWDTLVFPRSRTLDLDTRVPTRSLRVLEITVPDRKETLSLFAACPNLVQIWLRIDGKGTLAVSFANQLVKASARLRLLHILATKGRIDIEPLDIELLWAAAPMLNNLILDGFVQYRETIREPWPYLFARGGESKDSKLLPPGLQRWLQVLGVKPGYLANTTTLPAGAVLFETSAHLSWHPNDSDSETLDVFQVVDDIRVDWDGPTGVKLLQPYTTRFKYTDVVGMRSFRYHEISLAESGGERKTATSTTRMKPIAPLVSDLNTVRAIIGPVSLTEHRSSKYDMHVYVFGDHHARHVKPPEDDGSEGSMNIDEFLDLLLRRQETRQERVEFLVEGERVFDSTRKFKDHGDHFLADVRNLRLKWITSQYVHVQNVDVRFTQGTIAAAWTTVRSKVEEAEKEARKLLLERDSAEHELSLQLIRSCAKVVEKEVLATSSDSKDVFWNSKVDKQLAAVQEPEVKQQIIRLRDKAKLDAKGLVATLNAIPRVFNIQTSGYIRNASVSSLLTTLESERKRLQTFGVLVMDAYAMARMFRRFKSQVPSRARCFVIYAGDAHAANYRELFRALDFDVVNDARADDHAKGPYQWLDVRKFAPWFQKE